MPYNLKVEFIEATVFTRHVYEYLSEDEYIGLQNLLTNTRRQAKLFQGQAVSEKYDG
jgi:hypothetical protein